MLKIIPRETLQKYEAPLVAFRRHLHEYPEISFEEVKTSQFIFDELSKLEHATITRPTKTSVLVKFITNKSGAKIGLRADIDALAVTEKRDDLPFKSKHEGVMHACGHDGHTAILMGACLYFNEHFDSLSGEIWAIFQHAEELLPGGARELVATGLFHELDFIYGQHLWSPIPVGQIDLKAGPISGNTDGYKITIQGKGGHGSAPHTTVDPVIIGSMIIQKLQTIISRQLSPMLSGVISNTVFQAGNPQAFNVIPDTALLAGSVRSTTAEARELLKNSIEKMARSTCEEYGANCEIEYIWGYGVSHNDPLKTQYVKAVFEQINDITVREEGAVMLGLGGEDFHAFADIIPAVYAMVGTGNPEKDFAYPHHHPRFGLDEESFIIGLEAFVNVAINYTDYFNQ